jgi:hypothetical protein
MCAAAVFQAALFQLFLTAFCFLFEKYPRRVADVRLFGTLVEKWEGISESFLILVFSRLPAGAFRQRGLNPNRCKTALPVYNPRTTAPSRGI